MVMMMMKLRKASIAAGPDQGTPADHWAGGPHGMAANV